MLDLNQPPKSSGQLAYEAYCGHTDWKSLVSGAALPKWADTKPEIQAAWEAAALAVKTVAHDRLEVADRAVTYALNRIQTDPDVRYHCGFGTEMFARLCAYEALRKGWELEEVKADRDRDLQPSYRRRDPEILVLRARLAAAGIDH